MTNRFKDKQRIAIMLGIGLWIAILWISAVLLLAGKQLL